MMDLQVHLVQQVLQANQEKTGLQVKLDPKEEKESREDLENRDHEERLSLQQSH